MLDRLCDEAKATSVSSIRKAVKELNVDEIESLEVRDARIADFIHTSLNKQAKKGVYPTYTVLLRAK